MTRNESMDWAETLTSQPIGKILIAANTNDIVELLKINFSISDGLGYFEIDRITFGGNHFATGDEVRVFDNGTK